MGLAVGIKLNKEQINRNTKAVELWFAENPDKDICTLGMAGAIADIRRGHVREDVTNGPYKIPFFGERK